MKNHYTNLLAQAEKLYRHNRQGSFQTKGRYYEAFKRFLRFVAEEYRLEKLQNLSGKHMYSYFVHLKAKGLAVSTIKTEASAIRFWHDQIPNAKHKLPSNVNLSLERRRFGGVDRTWSDTEYNNIILECFGAQRLDYEACLVIARYAGLRIHEVMRIDTAIARDALKTGEINTRGKGGLRRRVPINEQIQIELESFLTCTKPGQKLFVPEGRETHLVIKEFQHFIREHRKKIPTPDSGRTAKLTFHGLRHTYAAEQYTRLRKAGLSELDARKKVAKLLGHGRDDVTRIYLAGVDESQFGGDDDV